MAFKINSLQQSLNPSKKSEKAVAKPNNIVQIQGNLVKSKEIQEQMRLLLYHWIDFWLGLNHCPETN